MKRRRRRPRPRSVIVALLEQAAGRSLDEALRHILELARAARAARLEALRSRTTYYQGGKL